MQIDAKHASVPQLGQICLEFTPWGKPILTTRMTVLEEVTVAVTDTVSDVTVQMKDIMLFIKGNTDNITDRQTSITKLKDNTVQAEALCPPLLRRPSTATRGTLPSAARSHSPPSPRLAAA